MNEKLKQWVCSFSGCDGGDLNSDIWLCGIEWGYPDASEREKKEYYTRDLPDEIQKGKVELDNSYNFFTDESFSFPFNRGFAKIYAALKGYNVEDYNRIKGNILKLNISPIGFHRDSEELWGKYNLAQITGFETKGEFLEYVNELNRFSYIREKYKPKLIVCVGVSRRSDFSKCFFWGYRPILFKYNSPPSVKGT